MNELLKSLQTASKIWLMIAAMSYLGWQTTNVCLGQNSSSTNAEPTRVDTLVKSQAGGFRFVRTIIGHRGASAEAPENTLSSIRLAIQSGANAVEIDVRQTKDRALVLMHDANLDKTTNGQGKISDTDLSALKEVDAGGWFSKDVFQIQSRTWLIWR